ncbi:hypothetical protein [Streptomyces griseomycini]|uniref:Secreted protein n=1 Tax=Streptomyces griseomycini TaxID=66895 RepID=A0A7W7PTE2_9ACTN|nr:hypothetical protein [Streptomyces griseomycini]MBB4900926.1 hypothetical protein [Streptomyces griseomycini]GGR15576.1 hypothetical protein GCM10015536_21420 [Streptomyces griseomycini]
MRALPARRIALGACCAALLIGITGPAATAAEPARERTPAASSDALLVQVRNLDAHEGELAPVVDLLEAVLGADGGHLPPAEARRLGEAAEDALEAAAAKAQATAPTATATATPTVTAPAGTAAPSDPDPAATATVTTPDVSDPAEDALLTDDENELTSDLLDAVREVVDSLLELMVSDDEEVVARVPASVDDLLAEVQELVDALTGTADPQVSILPAPAGATPVTQVPLLPAVTLPALPPLLLPAP